MQLGFYQQVADRLLLHLGGEEAVAVLAVVLGVIHRGIGTLQQLVGIPGVAWIHRDPGAGGNEQLPPAEGERLVEYAGDLVRNHLGVPLIVQVLGDHQELVAAQARGEVRFAQMRHQPVCRLAQQLVAGAVAQGIVDRLEVVQVEEEHAHRGLEAACAGERPLDGLHGQGAVGQPGQVVVVGTPDQFLLVAFALGDVDGHAHDAGLPAVGVAQRAGVHLVGMVVQLDLGDQLLAAHRLAGVADDLFAIRAILQQVFADGRRAPVAVLVPVPAVEEGDNAVHVDRPQRDRSAREHRAHHGLRLGDQAAFFPLQILDQLRILIAQLQGVLNRFRGAPPGAQQEHHQQQNQQSDARLQAVVPQKHRPGNRE